MLGPGVEGGSPPGATGRGPEVKRNAPRVEYPFLIAGLGNPGPRYADTRHNAGFQVLDRVSKLFGLEFRPGAGRWLEANGGRGDGQYSLLKPLTYMNLSGDAVAAVAERRGIGPERILVVCDDLDLSLGRIRIRRGGSSGGQKGLRSILDRLETNDVPRLRIGVGPRTGDTVDFVLSPFEKDENNQALELFDRAADAVLEILESGLDAAMTRFNG